MTSFLKNVEWGKPALSLLENLRDLEPDRPAILHIRHTERPPYNPHTSNQQNCTNDGRRAAVDFGRAIPTERKTRLHSTNIRRAEETAKCIGEGLATRGAPPTYAERLDDIMILHPENATRYLTENLRRSNGEVEASINFTRDWCAGHTPPAFLNSKTFADTLAQATQTSLNEAEPNGLDIYVTHDVWIACLLHHWYGIPTPPTGINYLDGFLIQPRDDTTTLWFRGEKRTVTHLKK